MIKTTKYLVILHNVSLEDNLVIGTGSIVTKDVPSNVLALSALAKIIKGI